MNWLNKLEQKYGSKAIPNITRIFIAANLIGSVLLLTKGDVVLYYLQFSASAILHGQVWRLISWIFVPSGSISFLQLLFIFCLWTLGDSMESYLGSFRMNVYFFGGFLLYDIVGMLICSDTFIHQSDYVLYTYSYVSDAWSFDAGGRGEALLCASYKDEVDGACLLRDVCI